MSVDRMMSTICSLAGDWSQAVLTEFTTVFSSGHMYPARQRIIDGMTLHSKGYVSKVTWEPTRPVGLGQCYREAAMHHRLRRWWVGQHLAWWEQRGEIFSA